ncbi:MAG: hypothetical protein R2883_06850 [Caldisericia bacterium]
MSLNARGEIAFADMPIVPPRIYSWIADTSKHLVIDVGGDKQGATALGQIIPRLKKDEYEFCLVINPYRPFTSTIEGIKQLASEVAFGAKARFTSIVGNPHIKSMTTYEDLKKGFQLIKQASIEMNLPIKFIAVSDKLYQEAKADGIDEKFLPLQLFVKYPWEDRRDKISWIYKR